MVAVTGSTEEASRQTGIPGRTIREWTEDPEFAELRQRTREAATEEWWAIVQNGFRRVQELLDSTTDIAKVATASAILADKMLVIRGEATSRYETRDLTGALDDHELATLRSVLHDAIGAGAGAEHQAEAAVVGAGTNGTAPA